MSKKKYIVELRDAVVRRTLREEKDKLLASIKSGETRARKLNRAHILLLADEGKTDVAISTALHSGESTVRRTRKEFVEGNLAFASNDRRHPGASPS